MNEYREVVPYSWLLPTLKSMTITELPGGVIEWRDPPDEIEVGQPTHSRNWGLISAQLKARPGVWAVVDTHTTWVTARIKNGKGYWAPQGAFEACQRTIGGVQHVFARYVGERSV